jgi:hypothetical protein
LAPGLYAAAPILTFDAPGAGASIYQGTFPVMVSDSGKIIGYISDSNYVYHGFIRSPEGKFTSIDAPEAGGGFTQGTLPSGIASDGKIVGFFYDPNNVLHGFLRDPSGKIVTIDAPLAGTGLDQGTDAVTINSNDEIAGYVQDDQGVYHGFLRSRAGNFTVFDAPNAGTGSGQGTIVLYGGSLNSYREICGFFVDSTGALLCFARKRTGVIVTYDPLAGSTLSFPGGLNDAGTTTGCALTTDSCYGFIRSPKGVITTFEAPFGALGAFGTQANAVSASGVITGFFGDTNNICHGFVRAADATFSEFDAPGAGTVPGSGQGTTPLSINSEGEIVGYLEDNNNVVHGFLTSPGEGPTAGIRGK